ncbi:glycosyltransferase family 4 protein [Pseudonocardia hierapolitana]|uniref:glycosyltransferase family 4 protein n=1 Tax=Pseudonocardia hierapolitana TaxID=1128676 RepID=UPI001478D47C|nr:glycosyltransferase family 4 protein [Pseudonocardia hierapolitana]
MRLVLVTAFPVDPGAPRGGVEGVSVVLCGALRDRRDLDLHIVTTGGVDAVQVDDWGAARIHRLPWTAPRLLSGVLGRDARRLREYVSGLRPDVVHAHDTYGIMMEPIGTPRVLTIHGFIHADTRVSGTSLARPRALLWKRIETRAWARYPHIISISPYVRERLTGIATGAVHNIDNPIADAFFDVRRTDGAAQVFCAATISPRKNTLAVVDGFARARAQGLRATLRLAGPQPVPAYAEAVRARIRQHGLDDAVVLLGQLSTDAVLSELAGASVSVLMSVEENAPLAVQEAMAAGVPVIASSRCGMPYQIDDGESGFLVEPDRPDDLAARLLQVIGDDGLRDRLARRARDVARERFHSERVATRTIGVYQRACGIPPPPARRSPSAPRAAATTGGRLPD